MELSKATKMTIRAIVECWKEQFPNDSKDYLIENCDSFLGTDLWEPLWHIIDAPNGFDEMVKYAIEYLKSDDGGNV